MANICFSLSLVAFFQSLCITSIFRTFGFKACLYRLQQDSLVRLTE
jgi:hypothetical protein